MPAAVRLTVFGESRADKEFVFTTPARWVVGRAEDCDIRVPMDAAHAYISRHHCALEIRPPEIRVHDLGSRNGTFVNGEIVGKRVDDKAEDSTISELGAARVLRDGDEVWIGNVGIQVSILPAQASRQLSEQPFGVYVALDQ